MKRSEQREVLMQMIYQMGVQEDFSGEAMAAFSVRFLDTDKKAKYFEEVYNIVANRIAMIDQTIESHMENWKIDRIAKVDLAIIRIGVAEILFIEETADAIAINEAVELGKKFGTDESSKFINGVLGKIVKSKNKSDKE